MNKRPLSITIIGWLFIVLSCAAFIKGLMPLINASNFTAHDLTDFGYVTVINILALLGGLYTLRGANGGRLLLVIWMIIHIIISFMHPLIQLLMHAAIFAVILYYLFRPSASAYFRPARFPKPESPV